MDDGPNASDSATDSLFTPGDVIGGRFTLRKRIGKSRAEVWLSNQEADPSWPRTVALKLIVNPSEEDAKRLREEHRICSREDLKDLACIPKSFDEYGECKVRSVTVVYLAREFVDGEDILKHANGRKLTLEARVELILRVCEGVGALHDKRLGHRDLKPPNILIDANGQPKLIDLGSAIDFKARQQLAPTIVTQAIHRTPGYEPPEAYGDDPVGAFTNGYEQWDVYSLGIVLADLLTGIRDDGRTPTELTPVIENELETHDTLRGMAGSLSAEERERAATMRGFSSAKQWLAAFGPLLENVSLKSRHDSRSERYRSVAKLTEHLRDWLSKSAEQRLSEPLLSLNKRARQVSIDEQNRYLALITGVASLVRERRYTRARDLLKDIDRGVGGDRSKHTRTWEYRHFDLLLNHLAIVLQHDAMVTWAEFSRDGTRVVTASVDGSARVWDAATGTLCAGPMKHEGPVNSATFSVDGTRVVTASGDGSARVWDATTGAACTGPMYNGGGVHSATFSCDGLRVVTASNDGSAQMWDSTTGAPCNGPMKHDGPMEHPDPVNSATFSVDGTRVVSSGQDATARVWDALTGTELARLEHPKTFYELQGVSASISEDGRHIATAYGDGKARVWSVDGDLLWVSAGGDDHSQMLSARFSKDGTHVVFCSSNGDAGLKALSRDALPAVIRGHLGAVLDARVSPDGTRVVTASYDETARVWHTGRGEARFGIGTEGPRLPELARLRGHEGPVLSACFSPDGKRILTHGRDDRTARVWTGTEVDTVFLQQHPDGLRCKQASLSPDGRCLVVVHAGSRRALLYDAKTGHQHASFSGNTAYAMKFVAFNSDGSRVVTCNGDGLATVWDVSGGDPLREFDFNDPHLFPPIEVVRLDWRDNQSPHDWDADLDLWVQVAAFSPDGVRIVTAGNDCVTRVFDVSTGEIICQLEGHGLGVVQCVAFSPDGTFIATSSTDGTAMVWDATTGQPLATLRGHSSTIHHAAFSPNGKRLVTASSDTTARVWDWKCEKEVTVLRGHRHACKHACFSPDGTRILTASCDEDSAELEPASVRLWHADRGDELATLDHPGVISASFSRDGRRIVTVASDGSVRTWHTETPQQRSAHAAGEGARAAAQTVLHGANARLSSAAKTEPPSSEEILREAEKDSHATPEVLAEVERMLRMRG